MLDDALLADWCLRYLGAPFERVLFRSGYLSDVVGVELPSGLRAVVKARPFQPRITGCLQVQAALARVGFPCPEPLTVATRVHGMTVTAETEVPGGSPLPAEAGPAPFAALLARLIVSAPAPAAVPDLAPSPPISLPSSSRAAFTCPDGGLLYTEHPATGLEQQTNGPWR